MQFFYFLLRIDNHREKYISNIINDRRQRSIASLDSAFNRLCVDGSRNASSGNQPYFDHRDEILG